MACATQSSTNISAITDNDQKALELVSAGFGATIAPDCHSGLGIVSREISDINIMRDLGFYYHGELNNSLVLNIIKDLSNQISMLKK